MDNPYINRRPQAPDVADRLGNIEKALGITSPGQPQDFFTLMGSKQQTAKKENTGSRGLNRLIRQLQRTGSGAIRDIKKSEAGYKQSLPEYSSYLASQVTGGSRSPQEAADLMANFGLSYNVPDAFKAASQLGGMTAGTPTEESASRYRPFQTFAAKALGINWSDQDIQETEAAARAMGKTKSAEEFSQFLGQRMMTDPRYISRNAVAAFANAPFGGQYGFGKKSATGEYTGRFDFNPPSTVKYS